MLGAGAQADRRPRKGRVAEPAARAPSRILVEDEHGEQKPASAWVGGGWAKMLKKARIMAGRTAIPAVVVVVHAKVMKEAWRLATSLVDVTAQEVVRLHGKRFTIKETFLVLISVGTFIER